MCRCVLAAKHDRARKHPRRRTFSVLALSVTGVLACALQGVLCAGVAQAEPPTLISYGYFSSAASFGVGVEQSSGDVYVAGLVNLSNFGAGPVNKFGASGDLISPPSPFGEANNAGVAVNPTNGDLYVLGAPGLFTPTSVYTYNPSTGALLSSFEVPASNNIAGLLTGVQIAADAAGNVYVPVAPQNEVLEYNPSECPALPAPCALTPLKTFTGGSGSGALSSPTGVSIDALGNLLVADDGNNRVEELSPADAPIGEIHSEGVQSVGLDAHGNVFALVENGTDPCGSIGSPCAHLVEYSSAGAQLADVGAASFGTGHPSLSQVAVSESNDRVYVTDDYNNRVWIFGPPTAPIVDTESTAEVTTSEAKLGALVDAGGIPASYRFEYGTTSAYGHSTPSPEGSVGEGIAAHAVWAAASGLAPGTTYHYRVVATNAVAPAGVAGPDQTFTTPTVEQAACPNEQLRGGFSARLPDCRAYELVTVPTKTSVQAEGGESVAADGDAIVFKTHEPLPGAPTGGTFYVASRGVGGWDSEGIIPLESYSGVVCSVHSNGALAFSSSLSAAIISVGHDSRASEPGGSGLNEQECNAEGLQVVSGEPVGYQNLLLRDNTGAYRLVNAMEPGLTSVPSDAYFKGASADLSHVVFSEKAPLTANAPAGVEDLYEWDEGVVRVLSVLPDGAPVSGSLADPAGGVSAVEIGRPAISEDGSHILFTSGGGLYVRIDGQRTVEVDESQGPGVNGGGLFASASVDGSRVFFTDESRLTSDSTAAPGEPDLYECVLPEGASKCDLSDLTVAQPGEHAGVLFTSRLGSKDGSRVYFVAKGVLAANKRPYTDREGKKVEEGAVNGDRNLYVWDEGTITYIATFGEGDFPIEGDASPDGKWFAFDSRHSLTGYDNVPSGGGQTQEVFLYGAASQQLVCASCEPTDEAPIPGLGGASLTSPAQRPVSDGGRVFFDTVEALVPSDTNGQVDVYEYEDGQPQLISSGTSPNESSFIGASESGDDVFFLSHQQLVPQDTEEEMHVIYDARVDGGLPVIASPPPCTTADACRSASSPQPSIYGAPSSQTFSGAGNLTPSSAVKPKTKLKRTKKKPKKKACKRGVHKGARCPARRPRGTGSKAKSHKGGK
jgi:hypothetical protein